VPEYGIFNGEHWMSNLDIQHGKDGGLNATVVKPNGNIDIFTYQAFRQYLQDLLASGQENRVVVDLANTAYIASSGWAVLLSQSRMLRRAGGKMVLSNMKDEIRGVYEVMNVETLLPCATNDGNVKVLLDAEA
jgi:anti-anti-sigma factor